MNDELPAHGEELERLFRDLYLFKNPTSDDALAMFERGRWMLDPDVEWHTNWPGLAPMVRGHDGVRRFLLGFVEPWTELRSELVEVREGKDNCVFIHVRVYARGGQSGADVEMNIYDALTYRAGRLIVRRSWPDPEPALAAAGLV
jgi:ketosteroid isomerase-like protein